MQVTARAKLYDQHCLPAPGPIAAATLYSVASHSSELPCDAQVGCGIQIPGGLWGPEVTASASCHPLQLVNNLTHGTLVQDPARTGLRLCDAHRLVMVQLAAALISMMTPRPTASASRHRQTAPQVLELSRKLWVSTSVLCQKLIRDAGHHVTAQAERAK